MKQEFVNRGVPLLLGLACIACLFLVSACGNGEPGLDDTAYWRGRLATGDADAIDALVKKGPSALPLLETLLADTNRTVVATTALVVQQLGSMGETAAPALIAALRRFPDLPAVAQALKSMKGDAVPYLIQALEDNDPSIQRQAAKLLTGAGKVTTPALPALIRVLESERADDAFKGEAILAVASISVVGARGDALPALREIVQRGGDLATNANYAIRRIEHAIKQAAKVAAETGN